MFDALFHALRIAIGLGLVIFVHELGHFLMAKWSGVRVERFSLGFGPVLARLRRGETEYVLSALPLGGYVHMLGESPDEADATADPRAFSSQSVGKRMGIISAGVVMNLFFGLLLYIGAFTMGVPFTKATVDAVVPGSPAWMAGLLPGDEILRVNSIEDPGFQDLRMEVALTDPDEEWVHLEIERREQRLVFRLRPVMTADRPMPVIGIVPPVDLKIPAPSEERPLIQKGFPGHGVLESGDRIVAVGDTPVSSFPELEEQLYKQRHTQFTLTVERDKQSRSLALTPQGEYGLGLRMQIGPVETIQKGSPADGKVEVGDVILAVDGNKAFDAEQLYNYAVDKALAGQTIELLVRRKEDGKAVQKLVRIKPRRASVWGRTYLIMGGRTTPVPCDVPALGLAYQITTTVTAVKPGSPAAKAGVQPGQTILAVREAHTSASQQTPHTSDPPTKPWITLSHWQAFGQAIRSTGPVTWQVRFGTQDDFSDAEMVAVPDPANPSISLGIVAFSTATRMRRAANLLHGCRLGWDKGIATIKWVYLTFRGMLVGQISPRDLGGPIRIGETAYRVSRNVGFSSLVFFLGLLSINLAVINFLPIPVLDGGHMLFLVVEKLRGKPASARALAVANSAGFLFIITLFVFLTYNDILRLVTGS